MIGIDEVGRGAWAGPLLMCAARLKKGKTHVDGLKDSKKLSKMERDELFLRIVENYDIGEGWVANDVLDHLGLAKSLKCGALMALQSLGAQPQEKIIVDGSVNFCKDTQYSDAIATIKADDSVPEVSAASIYAKVLRDEFMKQLDVRFPKYGYATNVGYGTRFHRDAIAHWGLTESHRKSFKISPVDKK